MELLFAPDLVVCMCGLYDQHFQGHLEGGKAYAAANH